MSLTSKKTQIFLLTGDALLRDRKIRELIRAFGDGVETHLYHARDLDPEALLRDAKTYPFLSSANLFRIKDADQLPPAAKAFLGESLADIPAGNAVVFEAEEIDKKDPLYQRIQELGKIFTLAGTANDLYRYVRNFLAERNRSISPDALELLLEQSANGLERLHQSLEKLVLLCPGRIDAEAVWNVADSGVEYSAFDLLNAFSKPDAQRVLEIFAHLYDDAGAQPHEILGILNWHLKRVGQARRMMDSGASPWDIAKAVRMPRAFFNDFLGEVKRFGASRLREIVEALFELDCDIKRGRVEPRSGLENFLIRYTETKAAAAR